MEIDFITAFGRLLRDGTLRDVFAANPQVAAEQIQLRQSDRLAWSRLVPADVEFQASVLLRKRLDLARSLAPETCCRLREKLWPTFRDYARNNWPPEEGAKISDTFLFCQHLGSQPPGVVVASEWNRLKFALSKRKAALHWVRMPMAKRKARSGIQFFLRKGNQCWREFFSILACEPRQKINRQ